MQDHITCPHCQKDIPLTQALTHQLEEKNRSVLEEEKKKMRSVMQKWQDDQLKKIEEKELQLEKDSVQKSQELEAKLRQKVQKDIELRLTDAQNERDEVVKNNKQLHEQLLEIIKQNRLIKTEREQEKIDNEKKLLELQDKIRGEEQKRLDDTYKLRLSEKDKKIEDALKIAEEYKRKLEQGSQQLQGEVLELELENFLKQEFPYDEIKPVGKGVRGGDIIQIVKNNTGRSCGTILWESKRTRSWSNEWLPKLKSDQRNINADLSVLITNMLPSGTKHFGCVEDVWVGDYEAMKGLAYALRTQLIQISFHKTSQEGTQTKMEILYNYLCSTEFKHRVESILEAYSGIQDDIEKEKRWFTTKWAKQERNLRKVIDNTVGMHGDLQSIMGNALGSMNGLELTPPSEPAVESDLQNDKNTLF